MPAEVTISCKGVEIYGITKVSIFSEGKKIITVLLFLFVCYVRSIVLDLRGAHAEVSGVHGPAGSGHISVDDVLSVGVAV